MQNITFYNLILKHAPKYIGASSLSALITLLMTKYYTWVFTPAEFGILALYLVMFQYTTSLVSLNLDSGSTRLYFDYKLTHRTEYLSTIFWLITFQAMAIFILAIVLMPFLADWIAPNSRLIYIITVLTAIGAVYVSFLTRILYNEHQSASILKHTVLQTFTNHISSVILISIFHLSILGRISGQGISYFSNALMLIKEFAKNNFFQLKFTFNKLMAKETFLLTLPSMITTLLTIGFIYTDRLFLKHYVGDNAVGIYTLGYMLGQGLSIVYEAVSQTILPKVFTDMKHNYDLALSELTSFSYRYYITLMTITIVISFLSPTIVTLISHDSYSQSSIVMPFVMAGFMMGGFYKIPSLILSYHKVVWLYPFLGFFSFGTNALLNWLLVSIYGIIGSAFASFIGLFLYSMLLQVMTFKYFNKEYIYKVSAIYIFIFSLVSYVFYKILL